MQDLLELAVWNVAACQPDNCRRRSQSADEGHKVLVLGEHNGSGLPSGDEDLRIVGVSKPDVHGQRLPSTPHVPRIHVHSFGDS
jgi:hypothetical protein